MQRLVRGSPYRTRKLMGSSSSAFIFPYQYLIYKNRSCTATTPSRGDSAHWRLASARLRAYAIPAHEMVAPSGTAATADIMELINILLY